MSPSTFFHSFTESTAAERASSLARSMALLNMEIAAIAAAIPVAITRNGLVISKPFNAAPSPVIPPCAETAPAATACSARAAAACSFVKVDVVKTFIFSASVRDVIERIESLVDTANPSNAACISEKPRENPFVLRVERTLPIALSVSNWLTNVCIALPIKTLEITVPRFPTSFIISLRISIAVVPPSTIPLIRSEFSTVLDNS